MSRTAIIGAEGFIGSFLFETFGKTDADILGTTHKSSSGKLVPLDLRAPDISALDLKRRGIESAIVAAGITSVVKCEEDPDGTSAVNVIGTIELLRKLDELGLHVVFLSSDYVFSGYTPPFQDDSVPAPETQYGKQKRRVELAVENLNVCIVRLSRVYSMDVGQRHFLADLFDRIRRGGSHVMAEDQRFRPTPIDEIARALTAIQASRLRGAINVCSRETWSRYEIGVAMGNLIENAGTISKARLRDLVLNLLLPMDTSMECKRLNEVLGMTLRCLSEDLTKIVRSASRK